MNTIIKKIKRFSFLFIFFIIIGLLLGYKFFSPKSISDFNPFGNNLETDYLNEESILEEIRNTNKLIPIEVELSETIVIDDSWGELNIFKKYKKIQFYATCSYSVDLSALNSNNINYKKDTKDLFLEFPKPKVYSININEEKTLFEKTENGFFRFGEVSLSTDEYNTILSKLNQKFQSRMEVSTIYNQAIINSEKSITDLISSTFKEDLNITISFK